MKFVGDTDLKHYEMTTKYTCKNIHSFLNYTFRADKIEWVRVSIVERVFRIQYQFI